MKKFITRVQDIRQKAADIASAIESAPPKIAELREAVMTTAGQMHQMRRAVQGATTGLVANDEERLIAALHEIDHSTETFHAAGYELEDVEMELATPQRLIVHLEKINDVPASTIRSLADANASHATTHAILTALLKAEDMADKVSLENLRYHQLMIYMGPVPTVRLCWRAASAARSMAAPTPVAAAAPATNFTSLLGQSSFFEQRTPMTPRVTPPATAPDVAMTSATPSHKSSTPVATTASSAKEDPLARFKKMPDLSRR